MFTPSQWQVIGAAKAALLFGILFVIVSCLRAEPMTTSWERPPWVAPVVEEEPRLTPAPAPEPESRLCRDPRNQAALVDCEALRR
jgi:hypothetical protein